MSRFMVFEPKSAALKEAIDDLEWPGSSIQITLQPVPPTVTFRGDGHGDLQVHYASNLQASTYKSHLNIFSQV